MGLRTEAFTEGEVQRALRDGFVLDLSQESVQKTLLFFSDTG